MKRISFALSATLCLLCLPLSAVAQEADMLDSSGHINTDILNPPTIERRVEEKIRTKSLGAAVETEPTSSHRPGIPSMEVGESSRTSAQSDDIENRSFQKYLAEKAASAAAMKAAEEKKAKAVSNKGAEVAKSASAAAIAAAAAKETVTNATPSKSVETVNPFTPRVPINESMALSPTEGAPRGFAPSKETAKAVANSRKLQSTVVSSRSHAFQGFTSVDKKPAFDLPITYNSKVKFWVAYFQGPGQKDFRRYLERSSRYLPKIFAILDEKGLPRDLAYVAMIESGFSSRAVSTASAVGYWQFIAATANRYGLKTNWWLDERRDITKSTVAAAQYLNDLYRMFNSWYLAAAAYNMGEGRVKRLVAKHQTRNYWMLSQKPDFPTETVNYIPKLMAALLIAKAPAMYGFSGLNQQAPHDYEYFEVPGGTDLENLAYYTGINLEEIRSLNPELLKGFVPQFVTSHRIRLPRGRIAKATEFIRASL